MAPILHISPSRAVFVSQILVPITVANALPRQNFDAVYFQLLFVLCVSPLTPCCFQPCLALPLGKFC